MKHAGLTPQEAEIRDIIDDAIPQTLRTLRDQILNGKEDRDKKDAAVKLLDVLSKYNLLPEDTSVRVPPIKFNHNHLAEVTNGLAHLAEYANLKEQFPKEHWEQALTWLSRGAS